MKHRFIDPLLLPGTRLGPVDLLTRAVPLEGTPGQEYVERRGVPCAVATAAGVKFSADHAGRPAVLAGLRDLQGDLTAVHGRYLHNLRGQNKMLTVGRPGGVISIGARAGPLILVEGLFDALSLAVCGQPAVATIGREVPWLVQTDRQILIAFDATRPGNEDAARLLALLPGSRRLLPPPRCKDWSTALAKRGALGVSRWLRDNLGW
ncbi:MAG TPA: toprim domain-containing protein [Myxococcales bacterium]|nr:toprim domain-containing protein [Myxococcales bacterium]